MLLIGLSPSRRQPSSFLAGKVQAENAVLLKGLSPSRRQPRWGCHSLLVRFGRFVIATLRPCFQEVVVETMPLLPTEQPRFHNHSIPAEEDDGSVDQEKRQQQYCLFVDGNCNFRLGVGAPTRIIIHHHHCRKSNFRSIPLRLPSEDPRG